MNIFQQGKLNKGCLALKDLNLHLYEEENARFI